MAENKNILEVHHLKKSFTTGKKSFTAVEDISFSLKTGEVLAKTNVLDSEQAVKHLIYAIHDPSHHRRDLSDNRSSGFCC